MAFRLLLNQAKWSNLPCNVLFDSKRELMWYWKLLGLSVCCGGVMDFKKDLYPSHSELWNMLYILGSLNSAGPSRRFNPKRRASCANMHCSNPRDLSLIQMFLLQKGKFEECAIEYKENPFSQSDVLFHYSTVYSCTLKNLYVKSRMTCIQRYLKQLHYI